MEKILSAVSLSILDGQMILVCIVGFVFFWKTFESIVFLPFLKLHESREASGKGAEEEATSINSQARTIKNFIERELFDARVEGQRLKDELLKEAKMQSNNVIKSAETIATQKVKEAERAAENILSNSQSNEGNVQALAELLYKKAAVLN